MRIAILGAGSIAYGVAAFLSRAGHDAVIWSPSRGVDAGMSLKSTGAIAGEYPVRTVAHVRDAVVGSDVVFLALPVNGHRHVMDAALPFLAAGQTVIISSHSSFGALYLAGKLREIGVELPIVVWGTTLLTARKSGEDGVKVNTVRQKVDMATLPVSAADKCLELCTELFGDRFVMRDGLVAIALSNLNPQNHLGIAMFNLTRMEKGETWGQGEHVTPAVGRLIEALDRERIAIAEVFGLQVKTVFEHFSLSFHVPLGSVSEMNQQMHEQGRGGFGPTTFDSRYIFEDVPYGLVPTAMLGRIVGRSAVLHEAGIALLSAAAGRDLAADNDFLPELSLDGLTIDEMMAMCR